MILRVKPGAIKGSLCIPASKSYSIRAFFIAACGGQSKIVNPSDCDDAKVAFLLTRQLGSQIALHGRNIFKLVAAKRNFVSSKMYVGESGTALRFLLPLLALKGKKVTVVGKGTLRGRPNHYLLDTLRKKGVQICGKGKQESIPITFKGGRLRGGKITIDGTMSSQFISALLIACPQLKEDTRLTIRGRQIVSESYITMTQK